MYHALRKATVGCAIGCMHHDPFVSALTCCYLFIQSPLAIGSSAIDVERNIVVERLFTIPPDRSISVIFTSPAHSAIDLD